MKPEISVRSDNAIQNHDSANQGLGTPYSLLTPSEPPEIKNWFSSYEYESFVLETNDNFGFSDHQESEGYEKECSTENMVKPLGNSRELETNNGMMEMEKKTSSMLNKCDQFGEENKCENQVLDSPSQPLLSPEAPGIENWFGSYAYESPPPDTMDDLILCDDKEGRVEHCNGKKKEVEEDQQKGVEECDDSSTKDGKNSTENHVQNKLCKESKDSFENGEILGGDKDEEATGGFVSVKNKREKDEVLENGKTKKRCVVGKKKMNKDERGETRKTLGDMTNIQPGKWKCPRKTKPHIAPPLKQLRLGQWFHIEQ